ncbi:TonB-dependent receptor [Mucilaginibacter myungsuensis]|uniref:TonB-dependent receptor n=1 Tax=Mucilaginibacter myungsuensis TaxID=649104 RepID=A0A929KVD5_9SPHI|nr:TonB-dependent receptor [Mucilaginibacter myungsuensis]MBE9661442.1 TonB-dependent receptor [Mucilaginibacter myungsuensis]MDN3597585.1 TonB-dependent receptor [Mucilaginibacter myungsuensis]
MKNTQLKFIKTIAAVLTLLAILAPGNILAQNSRGTITGKVVAANNEEADGVSIGLEGTTYGTITNKAGEFSFRAPAGSYSIVISYVGVSPVRVPVTVTAGRTTAVPQIAIQAKLSQLSDVNIIASRNNRFTARVSVDAAKIPLKPLENAQVYTTVTGELLREQQVFSNDDALRNAPGIQKMWDATGRAGDGGAYFTMRGFVVQTNLRNGVAGLVTAASDAVNTEKLEVIKGPSATLFGSTLTSFGGLINRVTKKPYESFGLEVGQTVGSYNLNRTSIDLNTPVTKDKNVLFRLNAAMNNTGTFQNYGKANAWTFAPTLTIKANDRLTITAEAELYYNKTSSLTPFFFFYNQPNALGAYKPSDLRFDYNQAYVNDDVTQSSRSTNYMAQANFKLSDKFTSQTLVTSTNSFSNGNGPYFYLMNDATAIDVTTPKDSTGAPIGPSPLADLPGDNNYIMRNNQATFNSRLRGIEIQENINGDFKIGNVRNRFVFGLDYLFQNSRQIYYGGPADFAPISSSTFNYGSYNKALVDAANGNFVPNDFNSFPYIYKKNTYSAYLSDVVNLTDQLLVSAGVRIDHFRTNGTFNVSGLRVEGDGGKAFNQTGFSPKFGLIYQPIKDELSLFANYQNGFNNPGIFTNSRGEATIAKLQNANQLEAGVKVALFNGKLNGTVSYYNIKVTNTLIGTTAEPGAVIPAGATPQIQDGAQRNKGFEADFIANPFTGFNVVAGFAYNESVLIEGPADSKGLRPNTAGSPYLANFYLSYRLPATAVKGLGVGFGGNYASNNKILNTYSGGTFELPEYMVFNANAFYDKAKYRVGLAVNNLLDKQYYTGYTTINPQRLRQFVLSASYKF